MYADGKRLVDIVDHLNAQSIPTKHGKTWTPQQVKRLLVGYQQTYKKAQTKVAAATRTFIEAIA